MTSDLEEPLMLSISHETLNYCVDYVDVKYKDTNSSCQMCGKETVFSKECQVDFEGEISVTFRTSKLNNYKGFEMDVVCFESSEQNLPGCIQTLPAEKEKIITTKEDSHSYYLAVRNCCNVANTFNVITI